ncbi:hypothetical protein TcasGA2_TC007977 [Tribolium castaneum]|uniref:Uncharacterized protein n=1 Tax=Tribolium castaneum TaxID=7070 RepID=D2A3G0_TRICA|nr:hypothetical protein TcasGA2_TC007977 [Tribolium castaneum]
MPPPIKPNQITRSTGYRKVEKGWRAEMRERKNSNVCSVKTDEDATSPERRHRDGSLSTHGSTIRFQSDGPVTLVKGNSASCRCGELI